MFVKLGVRMRSCAKRYLDSLTLSLPVSQVLALLSVTRLDDFWKLLPAKFLTKVAQIISNFLGYFEQPHSEAGFWVTFWNILATY